MKHPLKAFLCLLLCSLAIFSCKKDALKETPREDIPADVVARIKAEGFSTHEIRKVKDGYVVEGDIFLSEAWLDQKQNPKALVIAKTEQYRTTNLINVGAAREITVSISGFPQMYTDALDETIARYNALGLRLTFRRVASGGEISIIQEYLGPGVLGQTAGFPTAEGNIPSNPIRLSATVIGPTPIPGFITTVIAHEIGHCIGLRHTDYFDRRFSCGNEPWDPNEGPSDIGAINIPGTPTAADANSWMLACSPPGGVDRPFTNNDVIALQYLYGSSRPVQDGVRRFESVHSGKVLDVHNNSQNDGGRVAQWSFNGGNNQYWQLTYLNNGYYRIDAMHSGKSLTYNPQPSVFLPSRLEQWSWTGDTRQQWKISIVGLANYVIECRYNNDVIDVWDNSTSDGARVTTYPWNGGANQRWYIYN